MSANGAAPRLALAADRQISVGEKSYTLRFSVRAMAALQEHFGLHNLNDTAAKVYGLAKSGASLDDLVALLWAGLRTHHPAMSKQNVLDLVDDLGVDGLQLAIIEGLAAAAPDHSSRKETTDRPPVPG